MPHTVRHGFTRVNQSQNQTEPLPVAACGGPLVRAERPTQLARPGIRWWRGSDHPHARSDHRWRRRLPSHRVRAGRSWSPMHTMRCARLTSSCMNQFHEHCDWPSCACWCRLGDGSRAHPEDGHHRHWGPNTSSGAGDGYPPSKPVILDSRGVACCADDCPRYAGPDTGNDPNSVAIHRVSPKGTQFVGACSEHYAEIIKVQRAIGSAP